MHLTSSSAQIHSCHWRCGEPLACLCVMTHSRTSGCSPAQGITVLQHLWAACLCPARLPVGAINTDTGTSHFLDSPGQCLLPGAVSSEGELGTFLCQGLLGCSTFLPQQAWEALCFLTLETKGVGCLGSVNLFLSGNRYNKTKLSQGKKNSHLQVSGIFLIDFWTNK